jgi:hypothetical protein
MFASRAPEFVGHVLAGPAGASDAVLAEECAARATVRPVGAVRVAAALVAIVLRRRVRRTSLSVARCPAIF